MLLWFYDIAVIETNIAEENNSLCKERAVLSTRIRTTESLRLEKTTRSTQSNRQPSPPCPLTTSPCHTSAVLEHLQGRWLHHLPGQLCQCIAALSGTFFPVSNRNAPWLSLRPLPPALPLLRGGRGIRWQTGLRAQFCIYCEFCQAAAHLHVVTSHCALGKQPIFTTNLSFHHVLHVFCYLKQFSITFSSSGFLPSLHFLPISLFSVPLYQLSVLVSSRTLIFQGFSFYWNCDNYRSV